MNPIWPGRFAGKNALVSGAAGGLGGAIAERLLREGAQVIAADVSIPPHPLTGVKFFTLDVASRDSWRDTVEAIEDSYGPLDILAMCHGVLGQQRSVDEIDQSDWTRILDVNLTGCFHGLSVVLPGMVTRGRGRILALSSIAAKEGNPLQSAYSASKAGLIALVKSAAHECAQSGVTINCIAPTIVATPMIEALSPNQMSQILSKIPMHRAGDREELASLAAWVLSDEASFNTGQCFDFSGGRASY